MKSVQHLLNQIDAAYQQNLIKNYFVDFTSPLYISVALHDYPTKTLAISKLRETLTEHIKSNYTDIRVETCRLRYNVMWIYCEHLLLEDVEFIKKKKPS